MNLSDEAVGSFIHPPREDELEGHIKCMVCRRVDSFAALLGANNNVRLVCTGCGTYFDFGPFEPAGESHGN